MSNRDDVVVEMASFYAHVGLCSAVEGDVAEVGLGEGHAANHINGNIKSLSLDSYEIDTGAVNKYKAKEPLKSKHKIIEKDFITDNGGKKYDFIYIDVHYGDEESTDNAIAIAEAAKDRLKKGGKIAIEFWADTPSEQRLRDWLKTNYVEQETEVCGARSMPKMHIKYWTLE